MVWVHHCPMPAPSVERRSLIPGHIMSHNFFGGGDSIRAMTTDGQRKYQNHQSHPLFHITPRKIFTSRTKPLNNLFHYNQKPLLLSNIIQKNRFFSAFFRYLYLVFRYFYGKLFTLNLDVKLHPLPFFGQFRSNQWNIISEFKSRKTK